MNFSDFLPLVISVFTIATAYRMSRTSVSRIVPETCAAIWNALQQEVMSTPDIAAWKKLHLILNICGNFLTA